MNTMANMANMANMGGPVGAQGQMLNNNGALPHQAGPRQPLHLPNTIFNRTQFHTYIYEYLLRAELYDCARALYQADPSLNVKKEADENGNGLGDDPMDTDMKELDIKRPGDLPAPMTATSGGGSGFLFDWFCIFWDIFTTSKSGKGSPQVQQYVAHNQAQSRLRQEQQQQHMLRNMQRGAAEPNFAQQQQHFHQQLMARGSMPNGMMMKQQGNPLQRAAMANNQNPQAMMLQQKAAGMQRGPSDMDGNRGGPASPGSTDNAPSPSKRPRLDGVPAFNPNQAAMLQNGRPAQGMQGQQQGFPPNLAKNIATYAANLQQHHGSQMPNKNMANVGGPQGQGAPMVQQGGPDGAGLAQFYNPGDLAPGTANMRPGPGAQAAGSNHALQDYQMQLMLLEQQNKKRLMMARQEQDVGGNPMPRPDGQVGPGGPGATAGPGGQNFPGASPPGGRNGASPNPAEQMKRAGQQMSNAAMGGSPLPDGAQSRSSPNSMNFMGQNMDPNAPHFGMGMGMAGQMNGGMRPPGAHPAGGPPFNPQMATVHQQQMMAAAAQRHQAQQAQGGPGMQWQPGPNGQMPGQGPAQGTPQQRPMPPPSAPAAAAAAAGSRNATSSPQTGTAAPPTPQQANKPAPKKKETKKNTGKAAAQKKGTNVATGANPAAEPEAPQEPPTPATPITPVNPPNFAKNQNLSVNAPGVPNGQPAQAVPAPVPAVQPVQHPEQNRNSFNMDAGNLDFSMDFANPLTSNDVLDGFDFDSFLHDSNTGEEGTYDFSAGFMEGGEIGAD